MGFQLEYLAYVNGASLWIAFKWNEISHQGMIVLLDMHDETFPEMMLPSSLTNETRSNYDELFLFVSEESLCMVDNNYEQNVSSGPNELEIANDFIKPMSIRKNGEILWEANHRKKLLVSVDDVVEKSKDVDLGKSTSDWYHNPHYVTFYKKSLVLPDKWESNCVGDACEQSSGLCKREPKVGRRRLLSAKTKSRMRVASLLHMHGILYVSKMKGKWLQKNGRKSMQVKKPSLSN
ncbi:putative F-box protein-like isoform X3 [Capsicum annuum]|nr:putative F-box protein-like isoform X3 [Capsicum annuum]